MKNQASSRYNSQSGNIFFWIFLMIILFAALSYALSQGTRTGVASLSEQENKVAATEMIDFGRQVKETVNALRINGCTDIQLSFLGGPSEGDYTNPSAPSDGRCSVYGTGGKLRAPKMSDGWGAERLFFGTNIVESRDATKHYGTAAPDLTMIRQVSKDMCGAINKLIGNETNWKSPTNEEHKMWESEGDNNGARLPNDTWYSLYPFQGDYTQPSTLIITINDNSYVNGVALNSMLPPPVGCFCESDDECDVASNPTYYYYNVLWAR